MMEQQRILDWQKSGAGYEEGIELLRDSGADNALINLLESGETSYTSRKLKEAIADLFEDHRNAIKPKFNKSDLDSFPDDLKELHGQIIIRLRERSILQSNLYQLCYRADDQPRKGIEDKDFSKQAKEIMSVQDWIHQAYEQLDYFKEHGKRLPGTEPIEGNDLIRHLFANHLNASRYVLQAQSKGIKNQAKYDECKLVLDQIQSIIDGRTTIS